MNLRRIFLSAIAIAFAFAPVGVIMAQEEKNNNESVKPLEVGEKATDFDLEGIDGNIKLSERLGDDGKPVVLLFSRANW